MSPLDMSIPFFNYLYQKQCRKKWDCINSETDLTLKLNHTSRLSKQYFYCVTIEMRQRVNKLPVMI